VLILKVFQVTIFGRVKFNIIVSVFLVHNA